MAALAIGMALPAGLLVLDGPGELGAHDTLRRVAADIQKHGGEAPDVPRIVSKDDVADIRALLPEITDPAARERAELSVKYAEDAIDTRDGMLPTAIPSGIILATVLASEVRGRRKNREEYAHTGKEAAQAEAPQEPARTSFDDVGPEYID